MTRGTCMRCGTVRQLTSHIGTEVRSKQPVGICQRCTVEGVRAHALFGAENSPWEHVTETAPDPPRSTHEQAKLMNWIYKQNQRAFERFTEHQRQMIRRFYPDTGGDSLYLHNWHIVGNDDETAKSLDRGLWKLWRRVDEIYNQWWARINHNAYHKDQPGVMPSWCPYCNAQDKEPWWADPGLPEIPAECAPK